MHVIGSCSIKVRNKSTTSSREVKLGMMYLATTVPHPHGHWQLQELLGNKNGMGVLFFKINLIFFGYFDPKNIFFR